MDKMAATLDARRKGVDLCFLVDCTGSMAGVIAEMLKKVGDIYQAATTAHSEAIIRVAMVAYRDHHDLQRFEVFEFADVSHAFEFRTFLAGIRAEGGPLNHAHYDLCEDVLGGLKKVTELTWHSSTKVLIHIADMPCHGCEYQIPGWDRDGFPCGDPSGEAPEQYISWLCSRGIDYNFGEITEYTARMTEIFADVYKGSQAQFTVRSARDAASDFVPLVLDSVSSSIGRSPHLSASAGAGSDPSSAAACGGAAGAEVPSFLTPLLR